MKFVKTKYAALILMAALCSLWSCEKEESQLSEAVLASANTLNFETTGSSEKLITVYADADWVSEAPDWVTVTPSSGTGTMDVSISVTDNLRGGTPDNPRKVAVVFKGGTLASRAEVLVMQSGDKYRDVKDYTVGEIASLTNEAIVSIPNATVMAVTTEGFIVTDDQKTGVTYILNKTAVAVGDKIMLKGIKSTDTKSFAFVDCDNLEFVSTGGTVTYPEARDITGDINTYNPSTRDFIAVSGILKGSNITIEDQSAEYSVSITDAPAALGLAALNGHRVKVSGYYAGLAKPALNIIATQIEDKGVVKVIYFSENFEWLDPWAKAGNAGETVVANNLKAIAPRITEAIFEDVQALDALLEKGYEFLRVTTKTPDECIYLQSNYLKFGKTGYQAGIVLPRIETIPADAAPVLSFDWCPMRQESGKIDPVNLIVIITNGSDEATFDIPESGFAAGHKLEWIKAEIALTGVTITADTKITIRQTQWPKSTANRWFLDNIEISQVKK